MSRIVYDEEAERMPKEAPLRTNRNPWKTVILNIVTFGIYGAVMYISASFDINKIASVHDGKKTFNFLFAYLVELFTLRVVVFYWHHQISQRIGDELKRREIDYKFGTDTFWKWAFLGSFILVGPSVFLFRFCKAMNLLCDDYNRNK